MRLVEILARKLKKWPECATHAVQDGQGEHKEKVWMLSGDSINTIARKGEWSLGQGVWPIGASLRPGTLATDHATAIVTRADWEAERAKLKAPKANADGWIRHRGGKCPVEAGTLVDVRYRDGVIHYGTKALVSTDCVQENWVHESDKKSPKAHCDIMAYKIHKQAEQQNPVETKAAERKCEGRNCKMPTAENHSEECLLDAAIAQGWAGPLEWRDRIRELDTQREEVESTYQRQISEITQERESLVQKLAGEGLALVEVAVQPVEDMSDWRNWRESDLVQYVGLNDTRYYTSGSKYKICRFDIKSEESGPVFDDNTGHEDHHWGYDDDLTANFKWHSRPAS